MKRWRRYAAGFKVGREAESMRRVPVRPGSLLVVLILLGVSSCQGGKRFYPVRGYVFVDDKPAEGVTIIFHPLDDSGPKPVQPSAVVQADGLFVLNSYLVQERVLKEGAPAGQYRVTCTWYPTDLQKYLGMENLPDKLQGRYADPKTSGLQAEVSEGPNELPPFELKIPKK
jgi:hypothetical protein